MKDYKKETLLWMDAFKKREVQPPAPLSVKIDKYGINIFFDEFYLPFMSFHLPNDHIYWQTVHSVLRIDLWADSIVEQRVDAFVDAITAINKEPKAIEVIKLNPDLSRMFGAFIDPEKGWDGLQQEIEANRKKRAIAKLTPYERKLLGV